MASPLTPRRAPDLSRSRAGVGDISSLRRTSELQRAYECSRGGGFIIKPALIKNAGSESIERDFTTAALNIGAGTPSGSVVSSSFTTVTGAVSATTADQTAAPWNRFSLVLDSVCELGLENHGANNSEMLTQAAFTVLLGSDAGNVLFSSTFLTYGNPALGGTQQATVNIWGVPMLNYAQVPVGDFTFITVSLVNANAWTESWWSAMSGKLLCWNEA